MQRLLYVSQSRIADADTQSVVFELVSYSRINNARLSITGALIFTGTYFAQVLEGSPKSLQKLMAEITADPTHGSIIVVDETPINHRQFPDWQMAYHGPSRFVSRHVERLLHASSQPERRRAAEWLTELAREFTTHS